MKQPLELTVLMYHYIRDWGDRAESGSGIPGMSVETFKTQLDELSRRHTFVTWLDVRMALQGEKSLPDSACLLTFDDGVRDHYLNVFPILRDRNLSGLFFVLDRRQSRRLTLAHKIHFLLAKLGLVELRDAILKALSVLQRERYTQAENRYRLKYSSSSTEGQIDLLKAVLQRDLSAEVDGLLSHLFEEHVGAEKEIAPCFFLNGNQIREMSAGGMYFGGHSRSHPWFDFIDAEARKREISASAEWLRQFEPGSWAFANPYGGLSPDSPILLERHGFIAAFTTKAQRRHSHPYFIGRLDGEEIAQAGTAYA
jgi:hypothetical protein